MKVLLDTDPGSDIDDVIALAYLLAQPECELVGVTTVTGDVAKRADIARFVCREFGREDVPVLAGLGANLGPGPGQPHVPHWDALPEEQKSPREQKSRREQKLIAPEGQALDFIRSTVRESAGEITLLSIGPLTNLGALFAYDPELPGLCREIVSMAGVFDHSVASREWNAMVDPVATSIFYRRAVRQTSVGLNVTLACRLTADEVRSRFQGSRLEALMPMVEVFLRDADKITFHDILAAAVLFEPGLCRFEGGAVEVDLGEEPGRTVFTAGEGPHRVARTVDPDAFFEALFRVF